MRPRFYETATLELEQISVLLGRAYPPPAPATRYETRRPYGHIILLIAVFLLVPVIFMLAWSDPLTWTHNNAKPKPVEDLTQSDYSLKVELPDGRWVVATIVGNAKSEHDLPLIGNRIGDGRYVGYHVFVWLKPIGQTNPTWIDP